MHLTTASQLIITLIVFITYIFAPNSPASLMTIQGMMFVLRIVWTQPEKIKVSIPTDQMEIGLILTA